LLLVGEGSTQIKPNHSFDVQVVVVVSGSEVGVGLDGGEVIGGSVCLSLQPKNPGVWHVGVGVDSDEMVGVMISLQRPKYPGDWHVEDAVFVGVGGTGTILDVVAVVWSLQPNQPGVRQVALEVVVVMELAMDAPLVEVSSKQPHQPGFLQVSVLVLVLDVVLEEEEVIVSELLLS
jgi:hypothetical protein